jgi:hypothetical protein
MSRMRISGESSGWGWRVKKEEQTVIGRNRKHDQKILKDLRSY